jgi:hypothetical protein
MNESILTKLKSLRNILGYHSYMIDPNEKPNNNYTIPSIIEVLEIALRERNNSKLSVPDITLAFRDVIETLHQINQLLYCEEKGEIDFDFFETKAHLPISFDVSVISKYLLDCHHRFTACGIESNILILYTWLLSEAWYYILCQDTSDLWEHIIGKINEKIQYVDVKLYSPLIRCVPPERKQYCVDPKDLNPCVCLRGMPDAN